MPKESKNTIVLINVTESYPFPNTVQTACTICYYDSLYEDKQKLHAVLTFSEENKMTLNQYD